MRNLIKTTIPAMMAVFITACGGSDNSSKNNDQNNKELTYQGITEPVVLTEDNKEKVASEVIKFIKEYSVYRDFEINASVLESANNPISCQNESAAETKIGYAGNRNEKVLFTHKYDECMVSSSYKEEYLIVSGDSAFSFFEVNSLVSDVFSYKYEENVKDNLNVTIKGFPEAVKVINSIDYSYTSFTYSGLDEVKDDDIVSTGLSSRKISFSNSLYQIEYSYLYEAMSYVDGDSSYFGEYLFKFNGGESVKFNDIFLDYRYSGLFGVVEIESEFLGLPSIGILNLVSTSGGVEVCAGSSDLGSDSAYKNDFSSGTIFVVSEDKSLVIEYVGCGEYSVTLSDDMPF